MTAVAIIVSARPDMLAVCRAALTRFAPWLPIRVVATSPEVRRWSELGNEECVCLPDPGQGARDHAAGIEYARAAGVGRDADIVILLDDDTVILSDRWWPWIETAFAVSPNLGILGGVRSRGLVGQAYVMGVLVVHAHMMAMRGDLFRRIDTFHAERDPKLPYVRFDTGVFACLQATHEHLEVRTTPFFEPGEGPLYGDGGGPPDPHMRIDATEYYESGDNPTAPLWAHLGRGTSFAPRGWWRERARRVAAHVFGSPRAAKIIRRQDHRARFIARSWELVTEAKR
jgi:hypothetical protein